MIIISNSSVQSLVPSLTHQGDTREEAEESLRYLRQSVSDPRQTVDAHQGSRCYSSRTEKEETKSARR